MRQPGYYYVKGRKSERFGIVYWDGCNWISGVYNLEYVSDDAFSEIGPRIPDSPEDAKEVARKVWDAGFASSYGEWEKLPDFETFYEQLISKG